MGNYVSSLGWIGTRRGRKRDIRETNIDDDLFEELERELHTPKRRKMMTTSKYIYKTLFEEGRNSDVTIVALESEWRLHRVYLCQIVSVTPTKKRSQMVQDSRMDKELLKSGEKMGLKGPEVNENVGTIGTAVLIRPFRNFESLRIQE